MGCAEVQRKADCQAPLPLLISFSARTIDGLGFKMIRVFFGMKDDEEAGADYRPVL